MNDLILGQWNVICDRCGAKQKSEEVTKTWDGLIVCKPSVKEGCFEHRHPQDFVRAVHDDMNVPFTRPEGEDTYVAVTYISESVGTQQRTVPSGTFNITSTL